MVAFFYARQNGAHQRLPKGCRIWTVDSVSQVLAAIQN